MWIFRLTKFKVFGRINHCESSLLMGVPTLIMGGSMSGLKNKRKSFQNSEDDNIMYDEKVVCLLSYKRKKSREEKTELFCSPIQEFPAKKPRTEVVIGPLSPWKRELRVCIDYAVFYVEDSRLGIHVFDNEESTELHKLLSSRFRKLFISSLLNCTNFSGEVKLKNKFVDYNEGKTVYDFEVISTEYNEEVVFYGGGTVEIIFEGDALWK